MKNNIKNLLLYISAFVPMYVLIFIKLIIELINCNLTFNVLNSINFSTLLMLIIFGVVGLVWNVNFETSKSKCIKIVSKENITDQHFLGYFSLFVFFAIPLDLSYISGYCIYVIILIMIGVVYINNSLFYINPFLNLLGFNFYNVVYLDKETGKENRVKIFYRGDERLLNGECWIKIKNQHFCFLDKNHK